MTKAAQIIDLYRQAVEPREIADRLGYSVNTVNRAISDHRGKTGEVIAPAHRRPVAPYSAHEGYAWRLSDDARRIAFHGRAVKAARQARMAGA